MEIVEFHVGGVARFEHFHLDEGGDGLNLIGVEAVEKAVHELPPCPERIAGVGAAGFGEARHGALEGMGMGVDRGGEQDAGA